MTKKFWKSKIWLGESNPSAKKETSNWDGRVFSNNNQFHLKNWEINASLGELLIRRRRVSFKRSIFKSHCRKMKRARPTAAYQLIECQLIECQLIECQLIKAWIKRKEVSLICQASCCVMEYLKVLTFNRVKDSFNFLSMIF